MKKIFSTIKLVFATMSFLLLLFAVTFMDFAQQLFSEFSKRSI